VSVRVRVLGTAARKLLRLAWRQREELAEAARKTKGAVYPFKGLGKEIKYVFKNQPLYKAIMDLPIRTAFRGVTDIGIPLALPVAKGMFRVLRTKGAVYVGAASLIGGTLFPGIFRYIGENVFNKYDDKDAEYAMRMLKQALAAEVGNDRAEAILSDILRGVRDAELKEMLNGNR